MSLIINEKNLHMFMHILSARIRGIRTYDSVKIGVYKDHELHIDINLKNKITVFSFTFDNNLIDIPLNINLNCTKQELYEYLKNNFLKDLAIAKLSSYNSHEI